MQNHKALNFFAKVYSFEEKNSYHQFAFEYSDFRYVPENKKKLILESKVCCRSAAITKNAVLYVHRYSENPFSEKENEIIKRFANVFEQAYVRFMDLKKQKHRQEKSADRTCIGKGSRKNDGNATSKRFA